MAIQALAAKLKKKAMKIKQLGQDDPRIIIHSIKVGMALTLVSLFYYLRPLYDDFGVSGISAVITVVVIFEFTVGATLCKGFNRGLGIFLASALAVGVNYLAKLSGHKGEPFVLGILVFLIDVLATFLRFLPVIKARYDYGVLMFIVTFTIVSVSGYWINNFFTLAYRRLFAVLAGGAICIIISIVVCPVWAGETLHDSVTSNIDKLANYLEGFGEEYFHCSEDEEEHVTDIEKDKSFLQEYKVVLDSNTTEESLENFARWEPKHGKFGFHHPWKQYLKIGSFARQCAYGIEALNGYLSPENNLYISQSKEQLQFGRTTEVLCKNLSSELGKTLKALATAMKTMTDPSPSSQFHLKAAKSSIDDLKESFFKSVATATVAPILYAMVKSVEGLSEAVAELSLKAHFKSVEPNVSVSSNKPLLLHSGIVNPLFEETEDEQPHVVIILIATEIEDLPEK